MKKSIILFGIALLSFSTSLSASANPLSKFQHEIYMFSQTTPLCMAISKGEFEVVKKFVEYGASVTEKSNGLTPVMVAARYNNLEVLKYLVSRGATTTDKDDKGYNALKYAQLSNATEVIAFLTK